MTVPVHEQRRHARYLRGGRLFVALGLVAIGLAAWSGGKEWHIRFNGVAGEALVLDKQRAPRHGREDTYTIAYRFEPEGGVAARYEATVPPWLWRSLEPQRDTIALVYLADRPATHSIDGKYSRRRMDILAAAGLLSIVAGGLAIRYVRRRQARERDAATSST